MNTRDPIREEKRSRIVTFESRESTTTAEGQEENRENEVCLNIARDAIRSFSEV
jgi:hypothetical protein